MRRGIKYCVVFANHIHSSRAFSLSGNNHGKTHHSNERVTSRVIYTEATLYINIEVPSFPQCEYLSIFPIPSIPP